jgi:outer membrane lipoprotein-sorting protein
MLSALMLAATFSAISMDPLADAIEHYRTVESYRVTIRSFHSGGDEHIHYYYRKPGFVRMEFVHPHAGATLVYNPNTRIVRLRPFGAGHFPELELSPDNSLIQSLRGQRVDRSDVGALFENVHILWENGSAELLAEENMNGRTTRHFAVTGAGDFAVSGVHRFELWLDMANQFPTKIISSDQQGNVIETVAMEALEINPALPESLFNP